MARSPKKKEKKITLKDKIRAIEWGRYLTIILISAWMFVLGVFVGRGTAPVKFDIKKFSREIKALKDADIKKQTAPVEVVTNEEKTKTTLGFYEELKKSEPVPVPSVKPRNSASKSQEKSQKKTTTAAKTAPEVQKKSVSKSASTAQKKTVVKSPVKKPKRKTTSAAVKTVKSADTTATNKSGVTIQVASLKELSDADALVNKLKGKGYPAYKTIAIVPDKGIWFRIRVGKYSNKEAATGMVGRLKKDGYRPMVVKRK